MLVLIYIFTFILHNNIIKEGGDIMENNNFEVIDEVILDEKELEAMKEMEEHLSGGSGGRAIVCQCTN